MSNTKRHMETATIVYKQTLDQGPNHQGNGSQIGFCPDLSCLVGLVLIVVNYKGWLSSFASLTRSTNLLGQSLVV